MYICETEFAEVFRILNKMTPKQEQMSPLGCSGNMAEHNSLPSQQWHMDIRGVLLVGADDNHHSGLWGKPKGWTGTPFDIYLISSLPLFPECSWKICRRFLCSCRSVHHHTAHSNSRQQFCWILQEYFDEERGQFQEEREVEEWETQVEERITRVCHKRRDLFRGGK